MFHFESLSEGYSRLDLSKKTDVLNDEMFIIKKNSFREPHQSTLVSKSLPIAITAIITPIIAYADTFTNVYAQYLVIIDWLAVGVISAAGIAWMFGHRSKGIELLISAGIGYIVARKAMDIRNWLKLDVLGG